MRTPLALALAAATGIVCLSHANGCAGKAARLSPAKVVRRLATRSIDAANPVFELSGSLPGARVTVEQGEWATITWRSVRLRAPYQERKGEVWVPNRESTDAVRFLLALDDAGVHLVGTDGLLRTREGAAVACDPDDGNDLPRVRCTNASPTAESSMPSFASHVMPEAWMLPPSKRSKGERMIARAPQPKRSRQTQTALASRLEKVFEAYPGFRVSGISFGEGQQVLLVTREEVSVTGVLVCMASQGSSDVPPLDCTPTALDNLIGVLASGTVRLLIGGTGYGNPRNYEHLLVSLASGPRGLVSDSLELGGVSGIGFSCDHHPGYCVNVEGSGNEVWVGPGGCINLRRGAPWRATHVRVGDRWIDEAVERDPACVDRYTIRDGQFHPETCNPGARERKCP